MESDPYMWETAIIITPDRTHQIRAYAIL